MRLVTDRWRRLSPAAADSLGVFVLSRSLVLVAALIAALKANRAHSSFDVPELTQPWHGWPLDGLFNLFFSTLAQFDAVYYLAIAQDGYGTDAGPQGPAFFPLYPLATWLGSGLAASRGLVLIAATLISLVAFAGALYVLHRLAELEIGRELARPTLLLLALFPTAYVFSAPYSESLFLLVSVGAFYAARTGRWWLAGLLAALASAARPPGVALFVPLALLYLYGPRADRPAAQAESRGGRAIASGPAAQLRTWLRPRYRLRPDALWLLLAPLGLIAFSLHLHDAVGDGLAWAHAQEGAAGRHFKGPFVAIFDGVRATGAGIRRVANGASETAPAGHNLTNLLFLAFAAVATVGVFRRLPLAYGAYVVAALALPLSSPYPGEPLLSLPRFLVVLFPIFMWLAIFVEERRWTTYVVAASAVGLGLLTTEFATGTWAA